MEVTLNGRHIATTLADVVVRRPRFHRRRPGASVYLRPGCFLPEQVIGVITSGIARQ